MWQYFQHPVFLEKKSIADSMREASSYVAGLTLDIGCGEKPYAYLFKDRATHYIGLDIDVSEQKKVDICASSLSLPVRTDVADTVISNQTIEHVTSPEIFVEEISRVLKPGGTLILTAPQLWCLHEKPFDYYRFTRYALEHLCSKNRLEVLVLQERYGAFAAIGQMLSLMIFLPQSHKAWRIYLARPLMGCIQLFFLLLDRLFYSPDLTLGYVLIARKR